MEYRIVIDGRALPKERPREGARGFYTPQRTKNWEQFVATSFLAAHGRPMVSGRIDVRLHFSGKHRGDLDNLGKAILDGLNNVAYVDDRQIDTLILTRDREGKTYTEIVVREIE